MTKVHNFSAGPGILPQEVLKQASEACINFDNLNLSLLEISHRSKNFEKVMDESRALVKELFEVNKMNTKYCIWAVVLVCNSPWYLIIY